MSSRSGSPAVWRPAVPFRASRWLRGGTLQTVAGVVLSGARRVPEGALHEVPLPDGDRIALHDQRPSSWEEGGAVLVLIHGLCGSHLSPYMERLTVKASMRGVRVFRMDLRGCGAGLSLARLPYHSGRSEDAAAVLDWIATRCPGSPIGAAGFSLGANILLKHLGEVGEASSAKAAVAVCPPVELSVVSDNLARPSRRPWDAYFVRALGEHVRTRRRVVPDMAYVEWKEAPKSVREFDETFTAPICGFRSAAHYYEVCSSARGLEGVRIPTLLLAAQDDPMIPEEIFIGLKTSPFVSLHVAPGGGHLGFIAGRNVAKQDGDVRWMDWRVLEWFEKTL